MQVESIARAAERSNVSEEHIRNLIRLGKIESLDGENIYRGELDGTPPSRIFCKICGQVRSVRPSQAEKSHTCSKKCSGILRRVNTRWQHLFSKLLNDEPLSIYELPSIPPTGHEVRLSLAALYLQCSDGWWKYTVGADGAIEAPQASSDAIPPNECILHRLRFEIQSRTVV